MGPIFGIHLKFKTEMLEHLRSRLLGVISHAPGFAPILGLWLGRSGETGIVGQPDNAKEVRRKRTDPWASDTQQTAGLCGGLWTSDCYIKKTRRLKIGAASEGKVPVRHPTIVQSLGSRQRKRERYKNMYNAQELY